MVTRDYLPIDIRTTSYIYVVRISMIHQPPHGDDAYRLEKKKKRRLLLLPWIAASTKAVGFHAGPALPFPSKWEHCQVPITAG